jgi:hypothetical protein
MLKIIVTASLLAACIMATAPAEAKGGGKGNPAALAAYRAAKAAGKSAPTTHAAPPAKYAKAPTKQ